MIVRLCLCLLVLSAVHAEVTVKNGFYHDLVISFSSNVDAEKGKSIVDSLKNLLEDTSHVLHTAIGLRIGGVTFHFPPTWDTSTWQDVTVDPTSVLPVGDEDLLVDDIVDSAFGTQPFAFQYGGCGVPARRITLPVEFLNVAEGYPKGKLLAREWLKYRYGVFDENGYDGDDLYPSYYLVPGTIDPQITECTHPDVEYYFKDTDDNNCSLAIPFASSANCEIHPKEDSLNVTSSLMYFHKELRNMETVCGREHSHKDSTPSKQNVLCGGSSIWDILQRSGDFNEEHNITEEHQHDGEGIHFSYTQESKPRVVVAFEYSEKLHDQRQLILFAIRRFMHDLPDGSEFGLYSFNEQPTEIWALSSLTSVPDRDFAIPSDFAWNREVCTTCAVSKAVEALSDKPQVRSSIILIVGSDSSEIDEELVEKLKNLNVCLNIIAFTSEGTKAVGYEKLESASSCNSIVEIVKNGDESFEVLYPTLQKSVSQTHINAQISTINSGIMSESKSLNITMSSSAEKYTLWMARQLDISDISCTSGEKSVTLSPSIRSNSIASYTFDPAEEEVICKLSFPRTPEVLTQVEMTTKYGTIVDGEVWIHDTSESEEQMPVIIYAKINMGGYPIQDAKVTALVIGEDGHEDKFSLFDNGRGNPDITQHDGIYSRYFVNFTVEGEYKVFVMASDNGGLAQVGRKGQGNCCGSKVNSTQEFAGFFIKTIPTTFMAKKKPDAGFKPSKVMDLRVHSFDPSNSVVLKWTAPGGQADRGLAKTYIIKYFTAREDVLQNFNKGLRYNFTINPQTYGSEEIFEIRLDNDYFERNTAYYIAMRSVNDLEQESDTSNVVEFFLPEDTEITKVETTTDPSSLEDKKQSGVDKTTIGIVIGVLVLVIVAIAAVYLFIHFCVRKPRRKESPKTNGGSNRQNTTNIPVSMNSIPADVILKHHNEVVSAKNQHKDPPIFKEENLEPVNLASEPPRDGDSNDGGQRNNVEYSQVHKRQPEQESTNPYPPKSPKRMTNV